MTTGVMFFCDQLSREQMERMACRLSEAGFHRLWLPELFGREVFSSAAWLLARTDRIGIASGIANVYARDAYAAAQARHTLSELAPGRFSLGLGVSNPAILDVRGQTWQAPYAKMSDYLERMAKAKIYAPAADIEAPIFIAAHGPRLLSLASANADGANTYLMPVAHTRAARECLGVGPSLNVVQHCLLLEEPRRARELARRAVGRYLELDYYQRLWSAHGFDDIDFSGSGSDRLVDMLVAWGNASTIRARLDAHRQAGASEVIVVPLNPSGGGQEPDWRLLEALAA